MRKKLKTWDGRSEFEYEGDPLVNGTSIHYGQGFQYSARVSAEQYRSLLRYFAGRCVPAGTSRDTPPATSMGRWLQENVSKTALASYVGPILIHHGFAEREGTNIRFQGAIAI